mgnify:CR=1 FL=1
MSVGGIFQLVSNDGIQDQLIMQTEKLLFNIKKLSCERVAKLKVANPSLTEEDIMSRDEAWMPTLNSIEQSHVLFINSSFNSFILVFYFRFLSPLRVDCECFKLSTFEFLLIF